MWRSNSLKNFPTKYVLFGTHQCCNAELACCCHKVGHREVESEDVALVPQLWHIQDEPKGESIDQNSKCQGNKSRINVKRVGRHVAFTCFSING